MSLYFEDLQVGLCWQTSGRTVSEAEILAFAAVYDPQPLHLDRPWAESGPFGGLIASGLHTLALAWSQWLLLGVLADSSRGGIGIDELRWTAPVRPGDTLRSHVEVVDRSTAPRKGRGRVVFQHTVRNDRDEVVLTFRTLALVAARPEPQA